MNICRFCISITTWLLLMPCVVQARKPVRLHTLSEMNTLPEAINSHAGEERYSVLETDYEYLQTIPAEHLRTQSTAIYPRIKKMADGRYILFCQGGTIGSRIYYYTSDDLKTWSKGRLLFKPYQVTTSRGSDTRRFSTADAVVLANGDLLAVCSFRADKGYAYGIDCGLMLRRSRDHGHSWSEEQVIYRGTNWEPYLLQLPDGRIQCYFTDNHPALRNSGVSLLTSTDNGHTWHGYMRVCRQYKYEDQGSKIFTDQMPCFRVLNDGKTLFGFLEAGLNPQGPKSKRIYKMSIVRNSGFDWKALGEEGVGPSDRENNLFRGAAGYVATFPSGEVVLSCNMHSLFSLKIGNHEARQFNGNSWSEGWYQPFVGRGYWGSLEPIDSHRLIGAMHCKEGIQLGVFYLNHRIDAPHDAVRIDGDGREWDNTQALFLGSDSPAQVLFRARHDNKNFYLLIDSRRTPADCKIRLWINDLALTVEPSGNTSREILCRRRKAVAASGERGEVTEIAVPLHRLGAKAGDTLRFNASLEASDLHDTFTFARPENPDSWMRIVLTPKN